MNSLSQERWASLWRSAQAKGDPLPWYEGLATAYAEPHRHYHNQRHIAECLREFDAVSKQSENPQALEFALWFHDAVYDPKASDNEEKSADLAARCLTDAKRDSSFSERVYQLVMATKVHQSEPGTDLALMIDIDLAILGSSWIRFSEYERAIRGEYEWVPADVFCAKRTEILERFLARDRIYSTEWFQRKYEQQARENLMNSIQNLKGLSR